MSKDVDLESQLALVCRAAGALGRDDYLAVIVRSVSEALSLRWAFVSERVPDDPSQARTLAFCMDGQILDNVSYPLAGTPCADVYDRSVCVVTDGVQAAFPEGWNVFQIAQRLEALGVASSERFLDVVADPAALTAAGIKGATAEGYLFPATYEVHVNSDPADVFRRLRQTHRTRLARLVEQHPDGMRRLQRELGWGAWSPPSASR